MSADASEVRNLAAAMDRHRADLAALLLPIEPLAVVPQADLNAFSGDLTKLGAVAERLSDAARPFVGTKAPVGSIAFEVVENCRPLIGAGDPGPDPDAFDSLYELTRIAVGIGKLVAPQIESAAASALQLAEAIRPSHPAESALIAGVAGELRAILADLGPRVKRIAVPKGTRWARSQNQYFVRALDVAFRELSLGSVSAVALFDAARIGPQASGIPPCGTAPARASAPASSASDYAGYSFDESPGARKTRRSSSRWNPDLFR
jgi:hypothetical protein